MSLRAVKSPLAPKMTMVQGSTALRPKSRRQVNNSSKCSACSINGDTGEPVAGFQGLGMRERISRPKRGPSLHEEFFDTRASDFFRHSSFNDLCKSGSYADVCSPLIR